MSRELSVRRKLRYKESLILRCSNCGGAVRRIHRTFLQRFQYLAIFQCADCRQPKYQPRPNFYNFGPFARCPRCGTFRVSRLRERDRIDGFHRSAVGMVRSLLGAPLCHCRFCRVQFYDRRALQRDEPKAEGPAINTASSDKSTGAS